MSCDGNRRRLFRLVAQAVEDPGLEVELQRAYDGGRAQLGVDRADARPVQAVMALFDAYGLKRPIHGVATGVPDKRTWPAYTQVYTIIGGTRLARLMLDAARQRATARRTEWASSSSQRLRAVFLEDADELAPPFVGGSNRVDDRILLDCDRCLTIQPGEDAEEPQLLESRTIDLTAHTQGQADGRFIARGDVLRLALEHRGEAIAESRDRREVVVTARPQPNGVRLHQYGSDGTWDLHLSTREADLLTSELDRYPSAITDPSERAFFLNSDNQGTGPALRRRALTPRDLPGHCRSCGEPSGQGADCPACERQRSAALTQSPSSPEPAARTANATVPRPRARLQGLLLGGDVLSGRPLDADSRTAQPLRLDIRHHQRGRLVSAQCLSGDQIEQLAIARESTRPTPIALDDNLVGRWSPDGLWLGPRRRGAGAPLELSADRFDRLQAWARELRDTAARRPGGLASAAVLSQPTRGEF